jgi:hypothetical protein
MEMTRLSGYRYFMLVGRHTCPSKLGGDCVAEPYKYPILILCLDQKKYIELQKIEAQGTN